MSDLGAATGYGSAPRAPAAAPQVYALGAGVARVRREGKVILVNPEDGTSVRISKIGGELIPLLAQGATLAELERHLRARFPGAGDLRFKLKRFLGQLSDSGLLGQARTARPSRGGYRVAVFSPDAPARFLARLVTALPRDLGWGLLWALVLLAAGGIAALVVQGALPHPARIVTGFSWWGMLVILAVMLPLHEFAHALACRLAGQPVGKAGLIVHGFMPGPFVDTRAAALVEGRLGRFWIPAAGPLVDLAVCGAAAWVLLTAPGTGLPPEGVRIAAFVFLAAAAILVMNLNPLTASDGSHMIEALRDDELLRHSALRMRGARLSRPVDVAVYRVIASLYWQGLAVLLWIWWRHAY